MTFRLLTAALGLGAGAMYLLDPDRGQGRRASMRGQLDSLRHRAGERADETARHLGKRMTGLVSEARAALRHVRAPDDARHEDERFPLLAERWSPTVRTLAALAGTTFLMNLVTRRTLR